MGDGFSVPLSDSARYFPLKFNSMKPPSRWRGISADKVVARHYLTPTTFESVMNFNGSVSTTDVLATTDGLGRNLLSQQRQAPGVTAFDSTQTKYGWTTTSPSVTGGPFSTGSMPYVGTAGQSAPGGTSITTSQFDALGRPVTVTDGGGGTVSYTYIQKDILQKVGPTPTFQKQLEYDELGRLTSVCEITSAPGSGACGQFNPATGFLTKYTYDAVGNLLTVAQNSQPGSIGGPQNRSYTYDGLSRLTSEVNPESGTTQYFWDAAPPSCSNNVGWPTPGDLGAKLDNSGVYSCYGYDALHRLLGGLTSPSGPCFGFVYDAGTPPANSGIAITNTAGRTVEALTNNDCAGTANVVTDEWFSYDNDGNVTDMWELTPHSTQYYHSRATFAGNRRVTSVQLVSPSLYTMTYGLDGEGRWKTLTDTTAGQNIVTDTTFNAAGQPLNVKLTGTTPDQDIYTYDSSTGIMKTFEFEIGNSPANVTGTLTWNPNHTLSQMAIVDGFNSSGTQTCSSNSYDDVGRLLTFDCGSGKWGQQFSYDPYGNLTKMVISGRTGTSWNPGYSSTNHCIGCTYDPRGNVTGDGNNAYGWGLNNKILWTASSGTPTCGTSGRCATYDAFGRMVESSVNSTWKEYWYTQAGSQMIMAGTTVSYGRWPTGTGTAVISGTTGFAFLHEDWLGNARITSSLTGNTVLTDQAYTPFGELYNIFGSGNSQYELFAGITPNFAPGITTPIMWDTPNRELSSVGRWLSPDPAGLSAVDPSKPQTWNRYAYALNNPLSYVDPTGLFCQWDDGSRDDEPVDGGTSFGDCSDQGGTWIDTTTITVNGDAPNVPTDTFENGDQIFPQIFPANNNPCANVTLSAAGVNAQQQIATAQGYIAAGQIGASATPYPNPITTFFGGMYGYYNAVKTGGPNDIKNLPGHSGQNPIDVDAGNISFGITCPYGAGFCQFAAGLAQTLGGHPNFNGTLATGFDTPSDNAGIRIGQAMRASGCHE